MKMKILLPSIATIALCLCLIAGSTFALFTDSSKANIVVSAGQVKMVAKAQVTKVESVEPDANGLIKDENNATYSYSHVVSAAPFLFKNGGTATFDEDTSLLVFDNITPGDRVTFQISGQNSSDVTIMYRYRIEYYVDQEIAESYTGKTFDDMLMKKLNFTIPGETVKTNMKSYTSKWTQLTPGTNMAPVSISVELPVNTGNAYKDKNTMILVIVEAVQGNANIGVNQSETVYFD